MNREQAKEILKRHRPGTDDEHEPEMARALVLAASDTELARWFARYQASQEKIRGALRSVKAPSGLREQILTERPPVRSGLPRGRKLVLLASAAILMMIIAAVLLQLPKPTRFDRFETRMAKTALRMYAMDLETNDPEAVRAFLAAAGAPADYQIPEGLANLELTGCAALAFEGRPVSMICFRTGDELPPGSKTDLWLFVTDSTAVPGSPVGPEPGFDKKGEAAIATWSQGGATYLLVSARGEQALRSLL